MIKYENHFVLIKHSIYQEVIIILNAYISKSIAQNIFNVITDRMTRKREIHNYTRFSTFLSAIDRLNRPFPLQKNQ